MKEYGVFVPCDGEHLATTVTVPDGDPAGSVLLMTGLGAHRGHKFGVWTRAARRLAERGIASARFDYAGVGESTGGLGEWPITKLPIVQAQAVMRFAARATGSTGPARWVLVGNCVGAWTALMTAAREPECTGVGFVSAPVLSTGMEGLARRARRWRIARAIRRRAGLRRAAAAAFATEPRPALDLMGAYRTVLARDGGRLLVLFGEDDPVFNDRAVAQLDAVRRHVTAEEADRLELRVAPGLAIHGLDSVPAQTFAIDAVVEWAADVLAGQSASGSEPASASAEPAGTPDRPRLASVSHRSGSSSAPRAR